VSEIITLKVSDIIWREDLYPRFEPVPAIIQKYAEDIDQLPPVEVNQSNELIDGYHRWTAHKKENRETIKAFVTITESDRHFARLAMRRNSRHGFHINNKEKKDWLLTWYIGLNDEEKTELANDLAVSLRTVKRWTAGKDKNLKAKRKQKAFDLWLACSTLEEIAEELDTPKPTIINYIKEWSEYDKWHKLTIFPNHSDDPDWKPPIYGIWRRQTKSNKVSHPGNSEASFVDNLLYMYTEPFDIVVDPFGGGGSTIDVCKKRLRRYWISDRLPIVERRDIRQWDILEGPPPLHKRWSDVSLLFLDPPYWKQTKGEYSQDEQDLANMDLETFYAALTDFVVECAEKMSHGARIAMLMQPTQWRAPGRQVIDHVVDLITLLKNTHMGYVRRVSCPYQTEQYNAQQVNWAKDNREILVLNRELIIWEVL